MFVVVCFIFDCVFVARCICTSVRVCICLYFNISELMQERLERGQVVRARVHTPMQYATQNSPHCTPFTLSLAITSIKHKTRNTEKERRKKKQHQHCILLSFCRGHFSILSIVCYCLPDCWQVHTYMHACR